MRRLANAQACLHEFAVPVNRRKRRFILPVKPFTSPAFAAIISKDMCFEEESSGNAPQSEPEYGESPEGGICEKSPRSSEPNIFDQ